MGLGAQMISWHDDFCAQLAERGFHVIRYDNRDSGLSTKIPSGGYSFAELAGDVAAVAALLLLAKAAREWKAGRLRTAAPHPVAVPVRVLRRDE